MEDYAIQIREYLPIKFADEESNEFLDYLQEAYLVNLEKEKYQFSFSAFHMLYMTFVYKINWFLKQTGNKKIENSLQTYSQQNRGVVFNTLFDLSQIPEKTSLEKLLQTLSFHINEINICKNHVEVRNYCSHSCGKVYYKKIAKIEPYIQDEIEYIKKIQNKIIPQLKASLEDFIEKNWTKNFNVGYINDWCVANYISGQELKILTSFELSFHKKKSNIQEIIFKKLLFIMFIFEARKFIDIDIEIIFDRLASFVDEIPKEIKVIKGDGEEKEILTQEIIESYLIPIISQFDQKDRERAEKILNL